MEAAAATSVEGSLPKRDGSEERRFVFPRPIASLQLMASYRVALTLWYRYMRDAKLDDVKNERNPLSVAFAVSSDYEDESLERVEQLKMPKPMEDVIKTSLRSVHKRMKKWVDYCKYEILSGDFEDYRIDKMNENWCVWRSDGKLDAVRSAREMVHGEGLGDVQKFALMCKLCLEDELRTIDVHSLPADFCDRVTFYRDFLCFYWLKRLKNKLDEVPLENYDSVDVAMAANCEYRCWEAFEYFWDRLGDHDQVLVAEVQMTVHPNTWRYQPRIMTKMSSSQQRQLLSRIPIPVVFNFWIRLDLPARGIEAWNMVKDRATEGQFCSLFDGVLSSKVGHEESMRVLNVLWDEAPSQLKRCFVEAALHSAIRPFFAMYNPAPSAFTFLCKVLSLRTPEQRKQVMYEYGEEFATTVLNAWSLDEVIKVCLPGDEERIEFKLFIMRSSSVQERTTWLLNNNEVRRVKSMIQYYAPDPKTAQEYVRSLLRMEKLRKREYLLDYDKWIELREFIDELCFDDVEAVEIKKKFVSAFAIGCREDWNDDKSLNAIINVVGEVLDDEEIAKFKGDLVTSFRKEIRDVEYWPFFEEKYFLKFVRWCLKDEDEVLEFRRTIPIDDIFDNVFKMTLDCYENYNEVILDWIPGLNRCLRWWFGSEDEAKKYKLRRVYDNDSVELFRVMCRKDDDSAMDVVLKCFFEGDEETIGRVKAKRKKF